MTRFLSLKDTRHLDTSRSQAKMNHPTRIQWIVLSLSIAFVQLLATGSGYDAAKLKEQNGGLPNATDLRINEFMNQHLARINPNGWPPKEWDKSDPEKMAPEEQCTMNKLSADKVNQAFRKYHQTTGLIHDCKIPNDPVTDKAIKPLTSCVELAYCTKAYREELISGFILNSTDPRSLNNTKPGLELLDNLDAAFNELSSDTKQVNLNRGFLQKQINSNRICRLVLLDIKERKHKIESKSLDQVLECQRILVNPTNASSSQLGECIKWIIWNAEMRAWLAPNEYNLSGSSKDIARLVPMIMKLEDCEKRKLALHALMDQSKNYFISSYQSLEWFSKTKSDAKCTQLRSEFSGYESGAIDMLIYTIVNKPLVFAKTMKFGNYPGCGRSLENFWANIIDRAYMTGNRTRFERLAKFIPMLTCNRDKIYYTRALLARAHKEQEMVGPEIVDVASVISNLVKFMKTKTSKLNYPEPSHTELTNVLVEMQRQLPDHLANLVDGQECTIWNRLTNEYLVASNKTHKVGTEMRRSVHLVSLDGEPDKLGRWTFRKGSEIMPFTISNVGSEDRLYTSAKNSNNATEPFWCAPSDASGYPYWVVSLGRSHYGDHLTISKGSSSDQYLGVNMDQDPVPEVGRDLLLTQKGVRDTDFSFSCK